MHARIKTDLRIPQPDYQHIYHLHQLHFHYFILITALETRWEFDMGESLLVSVGVRKAKSVHTHEQGPPPWVQVYLC